MAKMFTFATILLALALNLAVASEESCTLGGSCLESVDLETDAGLALMQRKATAHHVTHPNAKGHDDQSLLAIKSHVRHSQHLATTFLRAAKAMPEASTTKSLMESFRICGQCSSFQRFGEEHDGGYLMCMDGLKKDGKTSVTAAYSLGVEHHDKWSEDTIKRLGIPVNQFDCTVDASDCKACKFHKKCIVSADGNHPVPGHESEGWSLQQALTETLQGKSLTQIADGSLLMKMDIESSEWPIYASEPADVLKKIGQLIVEFHGLRVEANHPMYLQAMQHIQAGGFKIAHLHGNNFEGMYETGGETIPNVVEVTFVHSSARPDGCAGDQLYETLDAPNNPGVKELPMAHLR